MNFGLSPDWAGYVFTYGPQYGAAASFTLPTVAQTNGNTEQLSSYWVGVSSNDGGGSFGVHDLIQVGFDMNINGGGFSCGSLSPCWYAWHEENPNMRAGKIVCGTVVPQCSQFYAPVYPGDSVFADVDYQGTNGFGQQVWDEGLIDFTQGWVWAQRFPCISTFGCIPSTFGASEWIVESPQDPNLGSCNHYGELPAFTQVTFSDPSFDLGGNVWGGLVAQSPLLNQYIWKLGLDDNCYVDAELGNPGGLYQSSGGGFFFVSYMLDPTAAGVTGNGYFYIGGSFDTTILDVDPGSTHSGNPPPNTDPETNMGFIADVVGPSCPKFFGLFTCVMTSTDLGSGIPLVAGQDDPHFSSPSTWQTGTYDMYLCLVVISANLEVTCPSIGGVLTAVPQLVLNGITASTPTLDEQQSITYTASYTGGSGSLSFSWSVPFGTCDSLTNAQIKCMANAGSGGSVGKGYFTTVTITDNLVSGGSASAYTQTIVYPDPSVLNPVGYYCPTSSTCYQVTTADSGTSVKFFGQVGGGIWVWTFHWSGLPGSCTSSSSDSNHIGDQQYCSFSTSDIGTYTISYYVIDGNGYQSNTEALPFSVNKAMVTPTLSLTVGSSTLDVGQSFTLGATASGGAGSYNYAWSGLPTGCSSSNTASLTCSPTGAGTFSITVSVTDAAYNTVTSSTFSITVLQPITVGTPVGMPPSGGIDVGQPVMYSVQVSGGTGVFTLTWIGLPPGCASQNASTVSCTPTAAGSYSISVTAVDTIGGTATSSTPLTYVVDTDPTVTAPVASPTTIVLTQPINFSATASGGSGGYSYVWANLPPGCSSMNSNQVSCVPTGVGIFSVSVTVTDSNGFSVTSSPFSFTVFFERATLSLTVAGTPLNTVNLTVTDNGSFMAGGNLSRGHGAPTQLVLPGVSFQVGHTYQAVLTYYPGNVRHGSPTGDNPAWLNITFWGCTSGVILLHHNFNVEQADTYVWSFDLDSVFGCTLSGTQMVTRGGSGSTAPPPAPPSPAPASAHPAGAGPNSPVSPFGGAMSQTVSVASPFGSLAAAVLLAGLALVARPTGRDPLGQLLLRLSHWWRG